MLHQTNRVQLGINIDHIATLRQARGTIYPDPVHAAIMAEEAGADGITMHLREDRRHIQDRDILVLNDILQTKLNLEMAVTDEMIAFAEKVQPTDCCLVPESRQELTTEGGLDVIHNFEKIARACRRLSDANVRVSLFIDADENQIRKAADTGAPVIEIHTGHYADATTEEQQKIELEKIYQAVECGIANDLIVNAGHGLHYHNVEAIAAITDIQELNIGHSVIARAVFTGLTEAVRELKQLMTNARLLALQS